MDSLSAGSGLTGAQKDELIDQVKQQIAVANAQELLSVRNLKPRHVISILKNIYVIYIFFSCVYRK